MFRQVGSVEAKPYKNHVIGDTGLMYAVDFDMGRSGVAYLDHDSADYHISTGSKWTSGNSGRVYRNDGVDIEMNWLGSWDDKNPYHVHRIETGEWLQYSFTSVKNELYALEISLSSESGDARFSIAIDQHPAAKGIVIPKTKHAARWTTVVVKDVRMEPGSHTLRLYADRGEFDFRSVRWVGSVGK